MDRTALDRLSKEDLIALLLAQSERIAELERRLGLNSGNSSKRIKSLCGAKPPQKLRWTNAGRRGPWDTMEISAGTRGVWADCRGLSYAVCELVRRHDGWR